MALEKQTIPISLATFLLSLLTMAGIFIIWSGREQLGVTIAGAGAIGLAIDMVFRKIREHRRKKGIKEVVNGSISHEEGIAPAAESRYIEFNCEFCAKKIIVYSHLRGQKEECPFCSGEFLVP